MTSSSAHDDRILIFAPRGRDAEVMASVLERDGLACEALFDFARLCAAIEIGRASCRERVF